jgi:hypothetical protein
MARETRPTRKTYRYPPGIISGTLALRHLRRFRDLVRHDSPFGMVYKDTTPIEKLLPAGTPVAQRFHALRTEINKTIPGAYRALRDQGIPTEWLVTEPEWNREKGDVVDRRRRVDVVADYQYLPEGGADWFERIHASLEQGMGAWELARRRAWLRKVNVVDVLGFVVSIPVRVLISAGIVSPTLSDSPVENGLLKALQLGWSHWCCCSAAPTCAV